MNQLAVLSCFKGTSPMNTSTLQKQSALPDSTLKSILDPLIRLKLFTFNPSDNTLCINERFKARHSRINLVLLCQSEEASQELFQAEDIVVEEFRYTPDQKSNILQVKR
jgi:hypothetical protein